MPSQVTEIGRYRLTIHTHILYSEIILLYPKDTPGIVGRIYFRRNNPDTQVTQSGQITNVYLPKDQYLPTVDILRNEKPVYFHTFDTSAAISTLQEDVGEEES